MPRRLIASPAPAAVWGRDEVGVGAGPTIAEGRDPWTVDALAGTTGEVGGGGAEFDRRPGWARLSNSWVSAKESGFS